MPKGDAWWPRVNGVSDAGEKVKDGFLSGSRHSGRNSMPYVERMRDSDSYRLLSAGCDDHSSDIESTTAPREPTIAGGIVPNRHKTIAPTTYNRKDGEAENPTCSAVVFDKTILAR